MTPARTSTAAAAPAMNGRPLRLLLGAFGDPGHAFPMLALGEALAARGHEVTLQTWGRWREHAERGGMRFAAAPEYHVFPTRDKPLKPYAAVVRAARESAPLVDAVRPDAVVADILTLAPALAGEVAGVPVATLIPHVDPATGPGLPPYSFGARAPRTAAGRALWRALERPSEGGLRRGRDELNGTRDRLGLPPLDRFHGGISRALCLVATFPQLEYASTASPPTSGTHVIGPLLWEPPGEPAAEPPPGDGPVVLVAPSTSQDRRHRLLGATLAALEHEPVRVIGAWNRRAAGRPLRVPANARMVDWLSYAKTMPRCDVVVCHAGHGTMARALASGCAVVAAPAAGDMNENAARLAWAGAGVRLPRRFASPRPLRLAIRRALDDASLRARARELAAWYAADDPAHRGAALVEEFARSGRPRHAAEPDTAAVAGPRR